MRLDDDLKYFEEPEFKEILAAYENARSNGQSVYMDAEDLTDVAEYYAIVLQDNDKADEAIALALQLHPDAVDPQIFKARQYMLGGELNVAQTICDAIDDQQHREVLFLKAELLVRNDRCDDAVQLLRDTAADITEDQDFFLYDSAYIFIDYQLYEPALLFARELEIVAPHWYKTWQLMADIHLGNNNHQEALPYIQRMLDVDPFCIEAWNWQTEAYSNLGDFTRAYEASEYALAIDPSNERSIQLKAWVLLQQGNAGEAHALYLQLEELNPTCESHWLHDSYALMEMDRVDDSYAAIKQAEALLDDESDDRSFVLEQMAQVLSRKGMVDEALDYLSQAEQIKGEEEEVYDNRMLRVRVLAENGRLTEALIAIHQLMENFPDDSYDIYYDGAAVLFDYAYYDTVVDMLAEQVETSDVVNPNLYAMLAYAEMSLDHHVKALNYLRKAASMNAPLLADLFADKFPNVRPEELYDYYFYQVYGHWPEAE